MSSPTLYIIAGPNGIGKTTSFFDIIPVNTPVINSDEIASEIRRKENIQGNTQEIANAEAVRIMDSYLKKRETFGIETNLADVDTWKTFFQIQESGYLLNVFYVSTNDLDLLNARIRIRHQQGGHFVRPDIVEERYLSGLNLLNHYKARPDKLLLYDNSVAPRLIAEFARGNVVAIDPQLPDWVTKYLWRESDLSLSGEIKTRDLNSIEEVRKRYLESQHPEKKQPEEPNKSIEKSRGQRRRR